jgi:hypothetical protein
MERVFVCGDHTKASIAAELTKMLHEKGCSITDLQVIKVEEEIDLDLNMETFNDVMALSEVIFGRLKDFKSACVMMSEEVDDNHFSVITYLMFSKTDDRELFDVLSTI